MQLSLAMLLCQLNKGLTQFILQTPLNSTLPCINVIYQPLLPCKNVIYSKKDAAL